MIFFALLLLVIMMLLRNMGLGFVVVGFVWLTAMIFNPNVDSGVIWLFGFGLGFIIHLNDD